MMTLGNWRSNIGSAAKGFTLVETLIVIGISVIAFIALVNLFLLFNSVYGYQNAFIAGAGSAGNAMTAFETAIPQASHALASHDFSGTVYASDADTLVLELPAIDGSGNILPGMSDHIVFYASGTVLYRLTLAGAGSVRVPGTKVLSTTLFSLSFIYDDADFTKVTNVTAEIETRSAYKEQTVASTLREQLYLRNLPLIP
jgi:hypothetical protein